MQARNRLATPRFLNAVQSNEWALHDAKGRRFLFSEACIVKGLIEAIHRPNGTVPPLHVGEQVKFTVARQTFQLVITSIVEASSSGTYVCMRFPACDRNRNELG